MKDEARVPIQPSSDLRMLMGGVVVEDDVNHLASRNLALDGIQETNELLMTMALHVATDDSAVEDVQRLAARWRPAKHASAGHCGPW